MLIMILNASRPVRARQPAGHCFDSGHRSLPQAIKRFLQFLSTSKLKKQEKYVFPTSSKSMKVHHILPTEGRWLWQTRKNSCVRKTKFKPSSLLWCDMTSRGSMVCKMGIETTAVLCSAVSFGQDQALLNCAV